MRSSTGWQVNAQQSPKSPLQFQAGDALQFDWSEEHVVLGRITQKIKVAHFRLCHSRKPFVMAYPGEAQAPFVTLLRNALPGSGWFWMPLC